MKKANKTKELVKSCKKAIGRLNVPPRKVMTPASVYKRHAKHREAYE